MTTKFLERIVPFMTNPIKCNADVNGCTANDGEPCAACHAAQEASMAEALGSWRSATFEEKYGKERYDAQLREAGRGHLVAS